MYIITFLKAVNRFVFRLTFTLKYLEYDFNDQNEYISVQLTIKSFVNIYVREDLFFFYRN